MIHIMKVAIVHELLTIRGGAERVAKALWDLYPDADVYTLLYDKRTLGDWFPHERVRASFLQPFAAATKLFNHHLYIPFFRRAVEAWDFSGYDLILSSSSAFIHGLRVPPGTAHVCYVHTPARYLWDQSHEVQQRLAAPTRAVASRVFHHLRTWDAAIADRPTTLVAASQPVQRRIQLYWNREATLVHPFADREWFTQPPKPHATPEQPFLVVANLQRYKQLDRAVRACVRANMPLTIVGDGPDRPRLEHLAQGSANIHFVGRLEGDALRNHFLAARALLIPGVEDFGINAVEALACGTPVITVRGGGTVDVIDDAVGATCDPSDDAFMDTLVRANLDIDPATCRSRAERFTRGIFEQQMYSIIEATISARAKAFRP